MDRNYTAVLTSCGRPHLLKETWETFSATVGQGPRYTIVIDDSGMERPEWFPRHNVTWIANPRQLGLIYCIDKAYAEVKTEAVFHLEDDWHFYEGGYLEPSFYILENYPEISTVTIRRDYRSTQIFDYAPGVQVCDNRNGWNGITFNPGLRRLSDYKRFGSYGRYVGYGRTGLEDAYAEQNMSRAYLRAGYRVATIPRHVYHRGDESHVPRSTHPLPRILVCIPSAPVLDYHRFHERNAQKWGRQWPNGVSGFQKNGPNDRQAAVRDTWLKDAPFQKNVSVEFFDGARCGCPDDHMHVIYKFLFACRYALENGFDYLFKCDDDSFVHLDRLVRLVLSLSPELETGGYVEGGGFYGGPGFLMNRRALEFAAKLTPPDPEVEWREDWWIGNQLRENGFTLHRLMELKDKGREAPPVETVTLHPIGPDEMRAMYTPLL